MLSAPISLRTHPEPATQPLARPCWSRVHSFTVGWQGKCQNQCSMQVSSTSSTHCLTAPGLLGLSPAERHPHSAAGAGLGAGRAAAGRPSLLPQCAVGGRRRPPAGGSRIFAGAGWLQTKSFRHPIGRQGSWRRATTSRPCALVAAGGAGAPAAGKQQRRRAAILPQ